MSDFNDLWAKQRWEGYQLSNIAFVELCKDDLEDETQKLEPAFVAKLYAAFTEAATKMEFYKAFENGQLKLRPGYKHLGKRCRAFVRIFNCIRSQFYIDTTVESTLVLKMIKFRALNTSFPEAGALRLSQQETDAYNQLMQLRLQLELILNEEFPIET